MADRRFATPGVYGPALVVHVFFESSRISADDPIGTRDHLAALWRACGTLCAETADQAGGRPPGDGLPDLAEFSPAWRVHAERRGSGAADGSRALLWTRLDTTGLSLRLASSAAGSTWRVLQECWARAVPAFDARFVIGQSLLLCGESRLAAGGDARISRGTAALGAALLRTGSASEPDPSAARPPAWSRTGTRLLTWDPDGVTAWSQERRLVLLAPRDARPEPWCWSGPDDAGPAPLTLHLLHAAKVRQGFAVLAEGYGPTVADDRAVEAAANALGRAHEQALVTRGPAFGGQVGNVARAMERLRGSTHELAARRASLRTLSRSAEQLHGNMTIAVPHGSQDRPGSPLVSDRTLAADLSRRAADLSRDLEETLDRAVAVVDLAGGFVAAEVERRRGHASGMQNAVVAGLLMFLGAVQAFQYRIGVAPVLHAPLICAAACLALAAPAGLQRLLPGGPLTGGPVLFDTATLGVLAGTSAWLSCTLVSHFVRHEPAAPAWSLAAALTATVLTSALGARAFLRSRT